MSDPALELLEQFRADVPEPDEAQRARAFAHATAAGSRRGRPLVPALVGLAVVAVAVAVALLAPGRRGPLDDAQAATVVRRVLAATETPASGILHVRYEIDGVPFAGAGRVDHVRVEAWRELGGEARRRTVSGAIAPPATLELFGAPGADMIYDPRTDGIYRLPAGSSVWFAGPSSAFTAAPGFAETLRSELGTGSLADIWTVTRTELDGRAAYRISNTGSPPAWPDGMTYYVDAATYVPLRIEQPGFPKDQRGGPYTKPPAGFSVGPKTPASVTVTTVSVYETLPATEETLALLDPQQAHPTASELPASQLRPDVAEHVVARTRPSATAAPAATAKPLLVDPIAGTIGSFRVGQSLLELAKVVPAPQSLPFPPGNLHVAAAFGADDGGLVVTFRDGADLHSTSAYLTRPFRTTRGDANGATLAELLARWPEHGAPQQVKAGTTVTVGKATFHFDASGRLTAVEVGNGDAASIAWVGG